MSIVFYLIFIFLLTLLGGNLPLLSRDIQQRGTVGLLAFTGSFLLGITLVDLIPTVFHSLGMRAGIAILVGYVLQLLLQLFSHGMEHSHTPTLEIHHGVLGSLLFGLSLHAFLEGIPLGYADARPGVLIAWVAGISVHKIPEAMTLMSILLLKPLSRSTKWFILIGFALVTPIAALLSAATEQDWTSFQPIMPWLVAIVAGSFLHIASTILFESSTQQHTFPRWKWLALLAGFVLAIATYWLE
ncbi:MAG: ZIP family metal transporter [Thermoflavifilum sp.]|nr:ZIP family metal transporter [Thermoflavifilum sp.]